MPNHPPSRFIAGAVFGISALSLLVFCYRNKPAESNPLVFKANSSLEQFELALDPAGQELRITGNGDLILNRAFDEISHLTIDGNGLDNTLTVDFTHGNPIPTGGLTYHGRDELTPAGDALALVGDAGGTTTYQPIAEKDGILKIRSKRQGPIATIAFTGLEPVLDLGAGPLTINGTAASNAITISDAVTVTNTKVEVDGFESLEFSNKDLVTVNGRGGADIITINDPTSATGLIDLTIDGQEGADTVEILSSLAPTTTLQNCEYIQIAGVLPGIGLTQSLLLGGGFLQVDLNGTTGEHDQLLANGFVDVTGTFLQLLPTIIPSPGDQFTIIDTSAGIAGTFIGLPEGASIPGGINGVPAVITYTGGLDNLDVVISVPVPAPTPAAAAVAASNGAELKRKIRNLQKKIKRAKKSKQRRKVAQLTKKLKNLKKQL